MNLKVDAFINNAPQWKKELEELRRIMLECPLTEELKWGVPCYTLEQKNVVIIHAFKEYCAMLFIKGALLKDEHGLLIRQTEQTQAGRQLRFSSLQAIHDTEAIIKSYVFEAIEIEKSGLKVDFNKSAEYPIPQEFQDKLDALPELLAAFDKLTPGRRRAYALYFSAPAQSKTRASRVEKYIAHILEGKGMYD